LGDEPAEFAGTSGSTPIWAALVACLNEALGKRVGLINPILYRAAADELTHDVVDGNNGAFQARKGWDACTGLGSPNGEAILRHLRSNG
jgi:kumamolisin